MAPAKRVTNAPPINQIFKYLQQQKPVSIWLYQQTGVRMTGTIKGFDEFMNIVVEDAVEISTKDPAKRRSLGMVLLKGDNITLISCVWETKEGGWLPIVVIVTCHMHHTAHKEWKLVQGGWFVQFPP